MSTSRWRNGGSDGERVGLGQLAALPFARCLEGLERPRLVDMDDGIELIGEPGLEVVREAVRLGPVDDPDRALEPFSLDPGRLEQEMRRPGLVEQLLPALGEGGAGRTRFRSASPPQSDAAVNGARVGGEADEQRGV